MPTYSHSKLSTFEQCRQKYKFNYIDKIEVPGQSVEAFMGGVVHEVLEKLYQDIKHQKMPTIKELLLFYKKTWEEQWTDEIIIVNQNYTQKNYYDMGARFIYSYYDHHKPFDQGVIMGIETQDFLDLGEGYKYHVRIDRLMFEGDGVYSVNDYKTNNTLPKQDKLDNDRQLAAYAIWVHETYADATDVKLVWHFLAYDRHMESKRSIDHLYQLKALIKKQIKEIEANKDYSPNVTALCGWCEFKHLCPAFCHEAKVEKLTAKEFLAEDGVKLVNELYHLTNENKKNDERIEEIKTDLINYSKQHNASIIYGSDAKASISKSESLKLPAKGSKEREEFENKLKKLGLYDDLLTIDSFAVKKLDDDTLSKLELEKEKNYSVRLCKKKDED